MIAQVLRDNDVSLAAGAAQRRLAMAAAALAWITACSGDPASGTQAIALPDIQGGGTIPSGTADTGSGSGGQDAATGGEDAGADTGTGEDAGVDTGTGEDAGADTGTGVGEDTSVSPDTSVGEDTSAGEDTTAGEETTVGEDSGATPDTGGTGGGDAGAPDTGAGGGDASQPACIDNDNDGFGAGCANGGDCDDGNPNFALVCPDCSKANHPGCPCKVAAANCYSGDPAWIGKGVCVVGVQLCKQGFWGTCDGEVLPQPEACNNKDDNCNGLIDEGVLSTCGTCDMSCTKQTMGPDFGNPFDPGKDSSNGVGLDQNGYIVLDKAKANFDLNHIWIANSGEATISKLDTKTGWEVGRYYACGSPSRTSVDLAGDVWVGCRSGGGVMKIAVKQTSCKDTNGNGKIDTSTDLNGDHAISPNEMLPKGQDECVIIDNVPAQGESVMRAAGVDKDNHVWMGGWNSKKLYRLEPVNGAVVDSHDLGCNPYGLTIDQKGVIWAQCPSGGLTRVDPATKAMQKYPYPAGAYGINVDFQGNIWVASGANASCFDTKTNTWKQPVNLGGGGGGGRGVATSNDGYVYVAVDGGHRVAKINAVTMTLEQSISLGGGSKYPVGIAVDFDGYVWAVNQGNGSASKIDPKINQVIGEYKVGSGPYTYSDMTGYTLHNYTAPKGHYTHVFGFSSYSGTVAEAKSKTVWENIDAEAIIPTKGYIRIRWRVGESLKDLDTKPWSKEYGPFPPATLPIDLTQEPQPVEGKFLQVEVFMQAGQDKISPILKSLQAKGKQIPVL